MKFGIDLKIASIVGAAALAARTLTAPAALAEPAPPAPPLPVPAPAPAAPPAPLDAEAPAQVIATGAADTAVEAVPHLPSPENLPPGTSDAPVAPSQPRLTYLRDLWHAMQTQEVSGGDALLLLTQRPMVADATPPAGLPLGPQAPVPAAPPPAPAPPVGP
ncbi:hypothetical protein [Mycolicibacterium hippocampi]|uniref:hypothetical protein n=1 Tax=Mycolicibacterium hippocampi TaxID=659824 RepID=UPI003512E804